MPALPEGIIGWPIPASFFLGPAYHEEQGSGVEAAVAVLESVNDRKEDVVELERERVAGRLARVFEWGPVGCTETQIAGGPSQRECTGTARAWIDSETGFFLGFLADDPDVVRIEVVVTHIDYAPAFDDGLFEFDPPPGAVEATD
jgi:outer membrane lipoprotein-sorting protein